ncbi:NADH dehydrogenase [ubiquinone] 1 alpha subcomplex subunit 13-like [Pectinophora gossypiella]|uniref:NADH dehydrogenase [ubiquinone] 1 alpha subcomplex subunit 13-like n=1 Tax=Pectinophora gossypiella TaxID=13191 RepID=UPI00214E2423|nr:NADH dehydrogenase [ubiquinone] 1 alpha subcomplex subunit 13-like [Pectinophora gossypiella]
MDSACWVRKQDLPPPGGYKPIAYKRVPGAHLFNGYQLILGYFAMTAGALYLYSLNHKKIKKHEIELRSSKMAIYPVLLAERDREYLRQLRRNRDEEDKLMAGVPGWKTGTYFGEPIYKMYQPEKLIEPIYHEYFAHCSPSHFFRRANLKLKS